MCEKVPYADAPVLAPYTKVGVADHRVDKAGCHAYKLCEDRGERRACGSHIEGNEKEKIKPYVKRRRENEEYERRDRIPDRTKDPADEVVSHLRYDAREYHEAVGVG